MPQSEKQEREKLQAAMTAYRVFLYLTLLCFISYLPFYPIIFSYDPSASGAWLVPVVLADLLIFVGLNWHGLSLRSTYLSNPYNFQVRPRIISALFLTALLIELPYPAMMSALTITYSSLEGQQRLGREIPEWIRILPQYFTFAVFFHIAAITVAIIMFVLFHQFKVIYHAREIAKQTDTLLDSDPLGIADELRRAKNSG